MRQKPEPDLALPAIEAVASLRGPQPYTLQRLSSAQGRPHPKGLPPAIFCRTSVSTSKRFALRSRVSKASPVIFPPGRARLSTTGGNRVDSTDYDNGDGLCRLLSCTDRWNSRHHNNSGSSRTSSATEQACGPAFPQRNDTRAEYSCPQHNCYSQWTRPKSGPFKIEFKL